MISEVRVESARAGESLARQLILVRHTTRKRANPRRRRSGWVIRGPTGGRQPSVMIHLHADPRIECGTGTAADATTVIHDGAEQIRRLVDGGGHDD